LTPEDLGAAMLPAGFSRNDQLSVGIVVRLFPGGRRKRVYRRVREVFMHGRFFEAAQLFADLCGRHPNFTAAHQGMARTSERLGRWEAAAEAWTVAVRLNPTHKNLASHATVLLRLGKVTAAETQFRRITEQDPSEIAGYRGLERAAV